MTGGRSNEISFYGTGLFIAAFEAIHSHVSLHCQGVPGLPGLSGLTGQKVSKKKKTEEKHCSVYLHAFIKCVIRRGNLVCMDPKASRDRQALL